MCAQIQTVPQLCPNLRLPKRPPADRQGGPLQRGGAEADGVSQPRRARGRLRCHSAGCGVQGDESPFTLCNRIIVPQCVTFKTILQESTLL